MEAADEPAGVIDRNRLAEITAGIVGLYRRHYGKGPTKAKTQMVEDTVICELEDFSTTAEKTLVKNGEHQRETIDSDAPGSPKVPVRAPFKTDRASQPPLAQPRGSARAWLLPRLRGLRRGPRPSPRDRRPRLPRAVCERNCLEGAEPFCGALREAGPPLRNGKPRSSNGLCSPSRDYPSATAAR